jgi:Capsular polysaccharide biosynthesis protein
MDSLKNKLQALCFWRKEADHIRISERDIHNHILPGVDDGFQNEDDSLEAIMRLAVRGVKEIVFTPHFNPEEYYGQKESDLRAKYEAFAAKIPSQWGIKSSLAAEYMCVQGFEQRASDPDLLTYEDGSILVEMSYYYRSQNLEEAIFNLQLEGRKPIIAHPERYLYMADCLGDFDKLHDMGARFQMNYMSLSGAYGPASMKILKYLRSKGYYSFTATDLHSLPQLDRILAILDGKK